MSNITVKQRQSGIELLKIIAMFLIVTFHVNNSMAIVDINHPTTDITIFTMHIFQYFGAIGNLIFFISSAWFLSDSNNMKLNKITNMIADNYVVSVIFLLIFLGGGGKPFC